MRDFMTEREFATDVVARLRSEGYTAYWAGGCVRDDLLGLVPVDYDVATDARPEQVQQLFRRCLLVGASFGVVEVLGPRGRTGDRLKVQVATFRSDGHYSDGRRPDSVTYSSAEADAQRRDFTINGMFFDPLTAQVLDYVGGQHDLSARILRAIGNPAERFAEDKLRVIRAVRLAARFELTIEPTTLQAAQAAASAIRAVSAERIGEELRKILSHPTRGRGVRLLREVGLLPPLFPEVIESFESAVRVVESLPPNASFPLALAALLHAVNPVALDDICSRLRLSNAERDQIAWLLSNQRLLREAPRMRRSQLYPILSHPGIHELLDLHRALDGPDVDYVRFCDRMLQEVPPEALNPRPLITGEDLCRLGLKPGPAFRPLLEAVRAAQLDGHVRTADEAKAYLQQRISVGE
jgi:poly(A) polymerase